MNNVDYEKWNGLLKKMQEPFQQIAELNVKTMQDLKYIKPEELTKIKDPEALYEQQVKIAVENGHKALDYLKKSFDIIEKTMLTTVKEARKATETKK